MRITVIEGEIDKEKEMIERGVELVQPNEPKLSIREFMKWYSMGDS